MELNVPVFELRLLKRHFYTFLVISLFLALFSILIGKLIPVQLPEAIAKVIKSWGLFLLLMVLSYLFGRLQKKELKKILNTEEADQKFTLYERYYKNKLMWAVFSQVLLDTYWLIAHSRFLFYVILIQLFLGILFYPSRRVISKELKDMEIVFV